MSSLLLGSGQMVTYVSYSVPVARNLDYLGKVEERQKAIWDAQATRKRKGGRSR